MGRPRRIGIEEEKLPLSKAAQLLLEECRMVLPGIQALFGFQMVAVFDQPFASRLTAAEQRAHLAAIALTVTAVALVMMPAALHRATGARVVTDRWLRLSTRLLLAGMWPLAASVCIDFHLVARVILGGGPVVVWALTMFAGLMLAWFVLPRGLVGRAAAGARSEPA